MRFLFGFGVASGIWALLAALLYTTGIIAIPDDDADDEAGVAPADEAGDEATPAREKRRRKVRRERVQRATGRTGGGERASERAEADRPAASVPSGESTTGDDLDWSGDRRIDMAAGEAQLAGTQIEAGFDGAMGKIRRCLVLVPGDGTVTGKLTFGMRVGGDGAPRAVSLTGPRAVTEGESGTCLRQAAQGIRFAKFDGPEMLFRYPITLH